MKYAIFSGPITDIAMKTENNNNRNVFGPPLDVYTTEEVMGLMLEWSKSDRKVLVCYVNAHCLNLAEDVPGYRQVLESSDIVYPDGKAVVWAARFLGAPVPERVNAGDFIIDFLKEFTRRESGLYLLGAKEEILRKAANRLKADIPDLNITGSRDGYFSEGEEAAIVEQINTAGPDLLILGMGVPRQELFLLRNREKLNVPVCWVVGNLFNYLAGETKRAPRWMINCGLEWAHRLFVEDPRRLWRRYLFGNPRFIFRVLKLKLKGQSAKK
jgi:N-acetylglucosaminyldiphosphoundecaprenol N-acetyl-beta-D-mannosaminyltransferase